MPFFHEHFHAIFLVAALVVLWIARPKGKG